MPVAAPKPPIPQRFLAPKPIPQALRTLYSARNQLAAAFPDHGFTIDGNIVGDIGEAIAAAAFGLTKLKANTKGHDMQTPDGRLVQVKATQARPAYRGVGLGLLKRTFELLLVLEFDEAGYYEVLYNGPGSYIDAARHRKKSASLSRRQLRTCQVQVPQRERLRKSRK